MNKKQIYFKITFTANLVSSLWHRKSIEIWNIENIERAVWDHSITEENPTFSKTWWKSYHDMVVLSCFWCLEALNLTCRAVAVVFLSVTLQVHNWELRQDMQSLGHCLGHRAVHPGGTQKCSICSCIQQPLWVMSRFCWTFVSHDHNTAAALHFLTSFIFFSFNLETRSPRGLLIRRADCGVQKLANVFIHTWDTRQK